MNRHHAKAEVPQKTRVIGFRITDHEHQKIIEAQKALRSLGISGTKSDTLRSSTSLLCGWRDVGRKYPGKDQTTHHQLLVLIKIF